MSRFIKVTIFASLGHLGVSLLLLLAAFIIGSGGWTPGHSQDARTGSFFFSVLKGWTAGYTYVWDPYKEHILPQLPADIYHLKTQEEVIALDRTISIRNFVDRSIFVLWAIVFGLAVGWIDTVVRKNIARKSESIE